MTITVIGDEIQVFGAHNRDGLTIGEKYMRKIIQDKLKAKGVYGVVLTNLQHPDPGAFLFEMNNPYGQYPEAGEL